jgi:hypothetical protein
MSSFGAVIPVTGLNLGFVGQVTRLGERVITSRPVLSTAALNINFGDPVVIIPNGSGGGDTYQSVADFIGQGGTFTAAKFAGVANREVKTNLSYTSLGNTGTPQIGSYAPNEMAEALERGSILVKINVGTPVSQGTVYVRTTLNGAIPAGLVGGFEAAADGSNTVALTGVVFRTGVLDANSTAEITLLNRVAA